MYREYEASSSGKWERQIKAFWNTETYEHDVKVHIESLSVAVSIGCEDIFVEGPIYTDGWKRGEDWKRLEFAKATP